MTVDKHELLFRVLNRGLFSLWANCEQHLAVKSHALREFFILDYSADMCSLRFELKCTCGMSSYYYLTQINF